MAAGSKIIRRILKPIRSLGSLTLSDIVPSNNCRVGGGGTLDVHHRLLCSSSSSEEVMYGLGPPEKATNLKIGDWAPRHLCAPRHDSTYSEINDSAIPGYMVRFTRPVNRSPISDKEMFDMCIESLSIALGTTRQQALNKIYLFSDDTRRPGYCAKIDRQTADKLKGIKLVTASRSLYSEVDHETADIIMGMKLGSASPHSLSLSNFDKETADKLNGLSTWITAVPDIYFDRYKDPRTRRLCRRELSELESVSDVGAGVCGFI